jgi:4-amino-4-deoxy-L-arabinose transferase-like glycosyltransferase
MPTAPPRLRSLREFLGDHGRFFLLWGLAALAFRIVFLVKFKLLTDDSFVYGDIAKNWLLHHVYGLSSVGGPVETYIRMPGYPFFLAAIWRFTGAEHYTAVMIVQIVIDIVMCLLIADLARRICSERAAKAAFVLAALCPFLANYAAVGLTETLSIFFAAWAMDSLVIALDVPSLRAPWVVCGIGVAAGILLRPDGGILLAAVGLYLLFRLIAVPSQIRGSIFVGAILLAVFALAPLVPWTLRNWCVMHRFQPLTPLYASMPDEFVPQGFFRWTKTWMVDYASVEDVFFHVEGQSVDVDDVPRRAFDDQDQLQRTVDAFAAYDDNGNNMIPEIDAQFAELAQERIAAHPFRYYVELPSLRAADLWLRPRTEVLPVDSHWWRYWDDPGDFAKALGLAIVNAFYLVLALIALVKGRVRYAALFILFAVIRTAFLAWMPNPEPRYVLECYPAVLAIAGGFFTTVERDE